MLSPASAVGAEEALDRRRAFGFIRLERLDPERDASFQIHREGALQLDDVASLPVRGDFCDDALRDGRCAFADQCGRGSARRPSHGAMNARIGIACSIACRLTAYGLLELAERR